MCLSLFYNTEFNSGPGVGNSAIQVLDEQFSICHCLAHTLKHALIVHECHRNAFWHKHLETVIEIGDSVQSELGFDLSQGCNVVGLVDRQVGEFLRW